ncbi:hypothetical protein Tco_1100591, partial [Tanacetum coccineum]
MSDDPSHSSSQRAKHLRGVVARIADSLNNDVLPLVVNTTNQVLKDNLRRVSPARIPILKLQEQLYTAMKDSPQAQAADPDIIECERVSAYFINTKKQHVYDGWTELSEVDDDEVILEGAPLEILVELTSMGDKRMP